MINIALFGCNGKMGQVISRMVETDDECQILFGFDKFTEKKNSYPVYSDVNEICEKADVVIDFSHPSYNLLPQESIFLHYHYTIVTVINRLFTSTAQPNQFLLRSTCKNGSSFSFGWLE